MHVRKKLNWPAAIGLGVLLLAGGASGTGQTAAAPVLVGRATEVLRVWQPGQHLYVKGNLGLSQDHLGGLEQWLRLNAANWCILLLETAQGEQFTDAEGHTYAGVEAVNQALGKGLRNLAGFAQLADPRTKEANGACFALFLKERNLSYFASAAQDNRGLGSAQWVGNLDRPAIAALRNGGRVLDAVKDTVTQVNRQLAARTAAETELRQKREAADQAARQLGLSKAKAAVARAGETVVLLESKTGDFWRRHPELGGNLVRPDLAGLQAELRAAQAAIDRGSLDEARVGAEAVEQHVDGQLRAMETYEQDQQVLRALADRLQRLGRRGHGRAAEAQLRAAGAALAAAQAEYHRGDAGYRAHVETASHALDAAETAIIAAQRVAAQWRALFLMTGFSGFAVLSLVGLVLNRRRAGVKREAEGLCQTWEKGLGEKNQAMAELLERRVGLIGQSAEEAAQRYGGETLRLGEQVIQDMDELLIMSACAGGVLEQVRGLLEPRPLWPRLGNRVSRRRYQQALGLLRDQPIRCRADEALELIVRGSRSDRERLLGDQAAYQPFTITFNQLIEKFNQRAQRALAALDLLESSLASLGGTVEGVRKDIGDARAAGEGLAKAALEDGLFGVPAVFERLLPAAQAALDETLKQARNDPVGALRAPGAQAKQQAGDAVALVNLAAQARQTILPRLRELGTLLQAAGLSAAWIQGEARRLAVAADQLAAQAVEASVADKAPALREEVAALANRAGTIVELEQARREQSQAAMAEATAAVDTAQREIGSALGLAPERVLREAGVEPSELLRQAQEQFQGSLAGLERGDVPAVQNALEAISNFASRATALVAATREAFVARETMPAALRAETERLGGLLPAHRAVLDDLRQRYAASVMLLGAGDPAHANANGTVDDNIEEAQDHLTAARLSLDQAVVEVRAGHLLAAAELWRQIQGRHETTLFRLAEITEKQQRLAAAETANTNQLEALGARYRKTESLALEATTMAPTVRRFEEASRLLAAARAAHAAGGDPFQTADELAVLARALEEVSDLARCDRDVFGEAERSLKTAATRLAEAPRLAAEAAAGAVGDSLAVRQARGEAQALQAALEAAGQGLRQPHGDWHVLGAEAERIGAQAGAAAATLRGEIKKAQAALAALAASAALVRRAGGWTGGYGVRILGAPGGDRLDAARVLLAAGNYDQAWQVAEDARRTAEAALARAEAEVQHRRWAEQQALAEARRRREAQEASRQSSFSPSWGGGGSGGGSSSWGGAGSGVSSSSFSSGSGVATSSW